MEQGRFTGSGWLPPGAEDYRPQRLANTPTISQATPDSFLPRWGKKPFGVGVFLGDRQPIRLLPLEGAVAVRRLRVLGAGVVCRFGVDDAGANDCRPHRLANTPTISQAAPDSFLPRWGKKPWLVGEWVWPILTFGRQ